MKSVLEVIQSGAAFLAKKGVESPRLNMEHLLAHALGLRRMDLYLQFDRPLSDAELAPLRDWTARRGQGEPLQHILGTVDFHRHTFKCDARGLIPRPETEELVEKIIKRSQGAPPARILDMGCGSGVIGLSLAAAFPEAQVVLADASPEALALARENGVLLGLADGKSAEGGAVARVSFIESDLFSQLDASSPSGRFDVLAANLPYIPEGELPTLSREVRRDPVMALISGEKGLDLIERFIAEAPRFCAPGALIALEHGPEQGAAIGALLGEAGFSGVSLERDLSGRDRFSFAAKA